jgi:hypothetical protein
MTAPAGRGSKKAVGAFSLFFIDLDGPQAHGHSVEEQAKIRLAFVVTS